jgi:3-phenylpropionate/trans-cinnamate dioxygenase ferredoxin subunit
MAPESVGQEFHRLGPADFGPGETRYFELDDHNVLVANCDGAFYAMEARCTHDNGPLEEGKLYRCEIECPRHGGKFDVRTGKATALPAFAAVASYPLRVVDGQIEVQFTPPPEKRYEDPRSLPGSLNLFSV